MNKIVQIVVLNGQPKHRMPVETDLIGAGWNGNQHILYAVVPVNMDETTELQTLEVRIGTVKDSVPEGWFTWPPYIQGQNTWVVSTFWHED